MRNVFGGGAHQLAGHGVGRKRIGADHHRVQRFGLPALGPSPSRPIVPSTMAKCGRRTEAISAMAMSSDFCSLPATGGSMCNSTLLRRQRQPFMFLTASVAPVCMCIFMTGIDTTQSNSNTSGQTPE